MSFGVQFLKKFCKMSGEIFEIDGGVMEGGGQILRMAMAFSTLLKKPIRVHNIRAGRSNPGLRAQHLTGLLLVRDICKGRLEGAEPGSTAITFYPGSIAGNKYMADTKTAGSVILLLQAALPCLMYADKCSELHLIGGTNADFAPPVEFTQQVFKPIAEKFNCSFNLEIIRKGFFPKGGGEVKVLTSPTKGLRSVECLDRGDVVAISGSAYVAGVLPIKMAHGMADAAVRLLRQSYGRTTINIGRVKDSPDMAVGNGSGIMIVAETSTGCLLAGTSLGKRGSSPEQVGEEAAQMLINNLSHGGCVDEHLQDQLIILMALAEGESRIRTGPLTLHTETAIHVAKLLTKAQFTITKDGPSNIIHCKGIALPAKTT